MEAKKYYRQILPLAIFAMVVSLFWIYWTVGRSVVTFVGDDVVVNWNEFEPLRWAIVIGYSVLR